MIISFIDHCFNAKKSEIGEQCDVYEGDLNIFTKSSLPNMFHSSCYRQVQRGTCKYVTNSYFAAYFTSL